MARRLGMLFVSSVLWLSGACSSDDGGGSSGPGGSNLPMGGTMALGGGGAGPSGAGSGGSAPINAGTAGSVAPGAGSGGSGGGAGGIASAGSGGSDTGAGSGGMDGMAGMDAMMAGAGAGGMMAMREDLGEGDMKDVVTIGDSFMNYGLNGGIEQSLDKISGRTYRHYAVAGTQVLNGQIPGQWTQAKNADPDIWTVVMTGGGNDIILDFFGNLLACEGAKTEAELSQACITALDEITAGVDALIADMESSGVKDVVYVGYGYVTNSELGGTIERTKRVQGEKCRDDDASRSLRCHFVDPSQQLIGKISADGIHPTPAGYDTIGEMVWQRMQDEGVRR